MSRKISIFRISLTGLEIGVAISVGILAGYHLDEYFDSSPWFLVGCLVLALTATFRNLYSLAKKLEKEDKEN
ncbi:MAG: AtpZ/AtpI family protein [Myxococcota bacterium]